MPEPGTAARAGQLSRGVQPEQDSFLVAYQVAKKFFHKSYVLFAPCFSAPILKRKRYPVKDFLHRFLKKCSPLCMETEKAA